MNVKSCGDLRVDLGRRDEEQRRSPPVHTRIPTVSGKPARAGDLRSGPSPLRREPLAEDANDRERREMRVTIGLIVLSTVPVDGLALSMNCLTWG